MSSWVHYVPLGDHAYYVDEGSSEDNSYWKLPDGVNPADVKQVRVAGDWSVEYADYLSIWTHACTRARRHAHMGCRVWFHIYTYAHEHAFYNISTCI